jgi:hypothetical protein
LTKLWRRYSQNTGVRPRSADAPLLLVVMLAASVAILIHAEKPGFSRWANTVPVNGSRSIAVRRQALSLSA